MNPKWESLFNDMQADISRCLALEHPEKENVESCFWIARNYWEQLQVALNTCGIKSDAEEIEFYREVKPCFASYIEYFSLLSEALQFQPLLVAFPDDMNGKITEEEWIKAWQGNIRDYWMAEENRGNRFYSKHQLFLDYCDSGSNEHDRQYFLAGTQTVDISHRRSHNRDTTLFTVSEEILTTWRAYQLYHAYIKKKVDEPVGS